jgi:hypothetical protein
MPVVALCDARVSEMLASRHGGRRAGLCLMGDEL